MDHLPRGLDGVHGERGTFAVQIADTLLYVFYF